ncbi:DeoR/GlpR family DNA-binding transcription regulator [Telmatospirillum sp.]|uniref:DeoR/GlpR family DNA-binding transcription regulator n=1 Tax=Telmatospirillum sp. TaxID=2079197 RepID=UPI00283C3E00|nr:DeoR/GlpR family DNA-binding transcription regulator [Telmatospirillum sp.]MDR3440016.1 DeoR/GlpR family DNA-binding transcription regulator [Telmatospirillum sp.]
MLKEERCKLILKCVEGRDAVSYEELLSVIDASSATLRRDVDQLCDNGKIRKIRGGVAQVTRIDPKPLQSYFFREHQLRNMAAKDAIARRALELVETPDTLILFGGTTVMRLAEYLPHSGLTVLTDSLPVTSHLAFNTENRVFMTGGEVLAQQGIVLSPFDEEPIHHIAASTFFVGCHAVTQAGIMEDDPLPLRGVRAVRKQAQRLVVLADSSKFLKSRSLIVCPLAEVDIFITDSGISDKAHKMLTDACETVLVADVRSDDSAAARPAVSKGKDDEADNGPKYGVGDGKDVHLGYDPWR